jgi:hypothetical protein
MIGRRWAGIAEQHTWSFALQASDAATHVASEQQRTGRRSGQQ